MLTRPGKAFWRKELQASGITKKICRQDKSQSGVLKDSQISEAEKQQRADQWDGTRGGGLYFIGPFWGSGIAVPWTVFLVALKPHRYLKGSLSKVPAKAVASPSKACSLLGSQASFDPGTESPPLD